MNTRTTIVFVLATLCACDDKAPPAEAPAAKASSTGAVDAPTKPARATCAAGEWAEPNGAFCIKLPEGFKHRELRDSKTATGTVEKALEFESPSGVYLSAYYRDTGKVDYEAGLAACKTDAAQAATEKKGTGIEAEGDAPKGTGHYFVYVDVNNTHRCVVNLLRGETMVHIAFSSSPDKKLSPEHIEACKSAYSL